MFAIILQATFSNFLTIFLFAWSWYITHRNGGKGNEPPRREKTEKPEGCRKLFAGNLSYNIDDATIVDFFKECGELTGLRWLTRQGTEEFRVSSVLHFFKILLHFIFVHTALFFVNVFSLYFSLFFLILFFNNSYIVCNVPRVLDMWNLLLLRKRIKP